MKKNKAKYIGIIIVVALLLGGAVLVAKNIFPTVNATLEITNALQPFLDAPNKSMHLLIDAEVEETVTQLDMDIYAIKEELDFFVIKQENSSFYIVNDLLLLENGKAFLLADEKQNTQAYTVNYMDMIPLLATAFEEFEINLKVNKLENQNKKMKKENMELKNENKKLNNENKKLKKSQDDMKSSMIWKLIKPVRKIKNSIFK